jgi:glycerol-3-phosphate O-acyltransferase
MKTKLDYIKDNQKLVEQRNQLMEAVTYIRDLLQDDLGYIRDDAEQNRHLRSMTIERIERLDRVIKRVKGEIPIWL